MVGQKGDAAGVRAGKITDFSVCSEFIMIVTSLQLFLWWKGGVGRSGTPLAHVPEPTSTI